MASYGLRLFPKKIDNKRGPDCKLYTQQQLFSFAGMEGVGVEREQLSIYHVAQLTWTKRQSQILDTTIGEKKPATDWYISPEKNLDSEGE